MMFFKRAFVFFLSVVFIGQVSFAMAGEACYSRYEKEAENGLRIHSELMVIGLTCQKVSGGAVLYSKYKEFTNKHSKLLNNYETALINFYRGQGMKKPERELHKLRTGLANGISKHAISMSTTSFCKHFAGRIDQALSMDHATIRRWAKTDWPKQKISYPSCKFS